MGIRCAVLFVESLDNSASRPSMRFASTCPAVPTVLVALEEESWQLSTLVLVTSDRTFTDEVVPRTHLSPVVAIEVHQVVHVKLIAHWTHLTTSRLLRCPGVRLNPIAQPIREVRDFIVLEDGVRFASLCQHAPRTDHILTVTLEVEQVTDLAVTDGNAARRLAIVHMQTSFARALDHQCRFELVAAFSFDALWQSLDIAVQNADATRSGVCHATHIVRRILFVPEIDHCRPHGRSVLPFVQQATLFSRLHRDDGTAAPN